MSKRKYVSPKVTAIRMECQAHLTQASYRGEKFQSDRGFKWTSSDDDDWDD